MVTVHLLLFSRAPRLGHTKTRLAAAIGPEAAREFHVHCLNDAIETCADFALTRARGLEDPRGAAGEGRGKADLDDTDLGKAVPPARAVCHLFITPPGCEAAFAEAGVRIPLDFQVHPQQGADLGARMANAFATVFAAAPADSAQPARALLFGSDLPLLEPAHLAAASAALERADAVFGPTEDGGYYLVGLKAPRPELFALGKSSQWGGADVLAETLARAKAGGLAAVCLDPLPDVDTGQDLARVRAHPRFEGLAARRACRFIATLVESAGGPIRG